MARALCEGAYRESRPKQGGWLQGRILTGTSQGAPNTILVDLFVQYAASAGLLSSPGTHATSCSWNHSPLGLSFHFRAVSCSASGASPCAAALASIGSGMLFWPRRPMFVFDFHIHEASHTATPQHPRVHEVNEGLRL